MPHSVERARALPNQGLEGDRYAKGIGTFSSHKGQRDVSLIETEAIEAFERESGASLTAAQIRRNILTRGVRLNDLVGEGIPSRRGAHAWSASMRTVHASGAIDAPGDIARTGASWRFIRAVLTEGEIAIGDSIDGFGHSP